MLSAVKFLAIQRTLTSYAKLSSSPRTWKVLGSKDSFPKASFSPKL